MYRASWGMRVSLVGAWCGPCSVAEDQEKVAAFADHVEVVFSRSKWLLEYGSWPL
ncbi:hypothetical protein F750_5066 [Streptomyces sp. PAMC 26508]|nr:hypothetical protein F750_5066 [Streptomyces sp. PAMC 26508]